MHAENTRGLIIIDLTTIASAVDEGKITPMILQQVRGGPQKMVQGLSNVENL